MAKRFPRLVRAHRLKRDIIATQITNDLVGVMGPGARAEMEKHAAELTAKRVPAPLAAQIAALPWLGYVADIAALAARGKRPIAAVSFRLREALGLDWIERAIDRLADGSDWHERARFALAGDLRASHTALAARAPARLIPRPKAVTPAVPRSSQGHAFKPDSILFESGEFWIRIDGKNSRIRSLPLIGVRGTLSNRPDSKRKKQTY